MASAVVLKSALFTDFYEVSKDLGWGSSGIVKLCKHRQSGVEFAAKFLNLRIETRTKLKREIKMHNITNSHPSFVRLVEAFDTFEDFVLVTELMKGGDISEYFSRGEEWKETYTIKVLRDLLKGIAFLHSKNIVHFDIKLDNILLTGPRRRPKKLLTIQRLMVKVAIESPFREESEIATIEKRVSESQSGEGINLSCSSGSPVILDKKTDVEESNDSEISSQEDFQLSDSEASRRENRPLQALGNVNNNVTSLMEKGIGQPVVMNESFNSVYVSMSELHRGSLSDVKKCWKQNTGKE